MTSPPPPQRLQPFGNGCFDRPQSGYDPRYFDPTDPLYASSTSPIPGQTAAQYRADTANGPRNFRYKKENVFMGIVIADSIGDVGPYLTGKADILGALISLDRVSGAFGSGQATIKYSSVAISPARLNAPYVKRPGTFRQLATQ